MQVLQHQGSKRLREGKGMENAVEMVVKVVRQGQAVSKNRHFEDVPDTAGRDSSGRRPRIRDLPSVGGM